MLGLDRRGFLAGAAAAALLPGTLRAAGSAAATGFTHGVASGEPGPDSVLLWTRYVGAAARTPLRVELAADERFRRVVARAQAVAHAGRDHTARVTVRGLAPGRRWHYRFTAPDGTRSATGRTATLPDGATGVFRLAVFSCASLRHGWFHAYAHAAARDDLDLAVHTGDYLYEYAAGTYPAEVDAVAGRVLDPLHALLTLADYRARYANYRTDPDLRALHERLPMIAVWDDHEFANDAWTGGAENHDPARDGAWAARRAAAERAWREWLPVSESWRPWAEHRVGDLATLLRLETRVTGRTPPLNPRFWALRREADIDAALAAFRDGAWSADANRMLDAAQERWLLDSLASGARRSRWQVLVQSVPMGRLQLPRAATGWAERWRGEARDEVAFLDAARRAGLPITLDNWNGFPAQRERVLAAARAARADLLVLSGDSHDAWAYELQSRGGPAGVELSVQAVTSPGWETWFPEVPAGERDGALVGANVELAWAATGRRGYLDVRLEPNAATATFRFVADVRRRDGGATTVHELRVASGARRFG